MKTAKIVITALLTAAALTSGCANTGSSPTSSTSSYYGATYGVIDAIEITRENSSGIGGSGIGAGAVIGALRWPGGERRAAGVAGGAVRLAACGIHRHRAARILMMALEKDATATAKEPIRVGILQ